ncbi:MAG TPA: hypothetical protein VIK33_15505 [Anaerolineae bacterium]
MSEEKAPPGISSEDWGATPVSVRQLVVSLQNTVHSHQKRPAAPESHLPLLIILFFNALIAGLLGIISNGQNATSCVHPIASLLGQGSVLLILLHVFWRTFRPHIASDEINVFIFKVRVRAIDELHPWRLSNTAAWSLAFAAVMAAWILGLSILSPFRRPEATPVIQGFYVGGETTPYKSGDVIQIDAHGRVRVEAILDQANAECTWSTLRGTLLPSTGCSVLYSPPINGGSDGLTVHVQSPCQTRTALASLNITVQP